MNEKNIKIEGLDIYYKRKPGRYDTKHLVVVFSGFSGDGKPTYNYENVLKTCPADVLWIKDYFHGGECYYLCSNGKMEIEKSIFSFISQVLNELGLDRENCTFLGGSKGGSAALYYGLKYNIKNIIATVPQFSIGSYVEIDWGYAFKHMIGNLSLDDVHHLKSHLDTLIEEQIINSEIDKNIYIITSLADPQYKQQIKNNIDKFKKFKNFNLLYANSDLITRHNQVNRHIVPVTSSILNLTAMGLSPVFEMTEIKYRKQSDSVRFLQPLIRLEKFNVKDKKIYLEGISVILGIPCPEYNDIFIRLILKNEKSRHEIELAKGNVIGLGKKYICASCHISYDKGWFCTKKYDGIIINELPIGEWDAYIRLDVKGVVKESAMISEYEISAQGVGDGKEIIFTSGKKHSHIKIKAIE